MGQIISGKETQKKRTDTARRTINTYLSGYRYVDSVQTVELKRHLLQVSFHFAGREDDRHVDRLIRFENGRLGLDFEKRQLLEQAIKGYVLVKLVVGDP